MPQDPDMRWDDPFTTGVRDHWHWIVCEAQIRELPKLTTDHHRDQRLAITAFDSGSISPSLEEKALGWSLVGDVMVSPPLSPDTHIPCDNNDEWYVFPQLPQTFSIADRYVNICGFTLADPGALAASQDPTWDPRNYDWLIPIQEAFWDNLNSIGPTTYVASGDSDIIATQSKSFAKSVEQAARRTVA